MNAPRVLMVIQRFRPTFTGHGLQIEALARELVRLGVRVEIATAIHPDAPENEPGEIPVHRFPMTATRNWIRLRWDHRRLMRYIAQGKSRFDILHVQGFPPGAPLLLDAARRAGLRTVITTTLLDSDDPLSVRRRGRLASWRFRAYRNADRFVAICPALADTFPRAGIPSERVAQIPIGVSLDRFHPPKDRDEEASALGWPRDVPRALFVGAVRRRKGVDLLLDAWKHVVTAMPEAHLYIAGPLHPGSEPLHQGRDFAETCRERAVTPPLRGRVFFLGARSDTERLYRAAHAFLFPSRKEGFPNVLLEALASGLPAVVTRIPGSTDVSVRHGETGFVVPQEDATALAERTLQIFRDPARRERFARAARKEAERHYAFPAIARAHLDLYRELLGPVRQEG